MDLIFQLIIIAVGYSCGAAVIFIAKLFDSSLAVSNNLLLILTLPIVCTLFAEGLTGRWLHTPGGMGLGGLTAFIPMLLAGFISAITVITMQKLILPMNTSSAVPLSKYLLIATSCSLLALLLWRFWPTPTAKLW